MNNGTKERTAARILASIGTVLAVWKVVFEFVLSETGKAMMAALVATIVACAVIVVDAVTTYYNNDFTEEACRGTAVTRQLKLEKEEDYIGDRFFTGEEEGESDEHENI